MYVFMHLFLLLFKLKKSSISLFNATTNCSKQTEIMMHMVMYIDIELNWIDRSHATDTQSSCLSQYRPNIWSGIGASLALSRLLLFYFYGCKVKK